MLATVSASTADPAGYVELDVLFEPSLGGERRRRVNRVATLDGGAVFNDSGYSDADQTIELKWRPRSEIEELAVARLVELYSMVRVSIRHGVYMAAPSMYRPGEEESSLRLLVASKLSE